MPARRNPPAAQVEFAGVTENPIHDIAPTLFMTQYKQVHTLILVFFWWAFDDIESKLDQGLDLFGMQITGSREVCLFLPVNKTLELPEKGTHRA